MGIFSSRDMRAGEELLCNYGYEVDRSLVPAWYRDLWAREQQMASAAGARRDAVKPF